MRRFLLLLFTLLLLGQAGGISCGAARCDCRHAGACASLACSRDCCSGFSTCSACPGCGLKNAEKLFVKRANVQLHEVFFGNAFTFYPDVGYGAPAYPCESFSGERASPRFSPRAPPLA